MPDILVYRKNEGESILPNDYQEVEYLENTSGIETTSGSGESSYVGSYINTGIHPIANSKVEMKFRFSTDTNAFRCLFGGYDSNTKNYGLVVTNNNLYIMYGYQTSRSLTHNFVKDVWYTLVFDTYNKQITITGNGYTDTYSFSELSLSEQSDLSIYLFTDNAIGSMVQYNTIYTLKGDIEYFKYYDSYDDTDPSYNFIPCYLKSNSVAGMYDLVNDIFYTNSGTGTFTVGPIVGATFDYKVSEKYIIISSKTSNKLTQYAKKTLTEITAEDLSGVTSLLSTFAGQTNLTKVVLPDGLTSICGNAFYGCTNLSEITVPATFITDNAQTFRGVSNNLKIYYNGTLGQWLSILNTANGLHGQVYINNQVLTDVTIPNTITTLYGGRIAYNTTITSLTIPSSVIEITDHALYGLSALSSISFAEGLTTIGQNFLRGCNSLTYVDLPSSVTSIGTYMDYSTNINKTWIFRSINPPTLGTSFTTKSSTIIIVPYDSLTAYKTATNWSAKASIMHGFGTFASGETLPTTTTDGTYTLTWYASISDMSAGTNPITVGNGDEIYCNAV